MKEYAKTMLLVGVALTAASVGAYASKMEQPISLGLLILGVAALTGAFTVCVMNIGIGVGVELVGDPEEDEDHGAL